MDLSPINESDDTFGMNCSDENNLGDENVAAVESNPTNKRNRESNPINKRNRSSSSSVWKNFTKIGVGKDGKERAKCNGCKKDYVGGGREAGTSTLKRHMVRCQKLKKNKD
ncbi:hypothetical protein A2U01_0056182, partial [Trifolium medium]|nr:hypothetical protein [Trifolium medium]